MKTHARIALGAMALTIISVAGYAAGPAWWVSRGAIDINKAPQDFAPVTLGQLKWMATKAKEELDAFVPGGAGTAVNALVDSWSTLQGDGSRLPIVTASTHDYAPANLGQLKAAAKPYWDRLVTQGYATASEYPWTAPTTDDDNYALANLGQLKTLFAVGSDRDNDGLPDNFELQYAGSLGVLSGNGVADTDGDGLSDLAEYQLAWNPVSNDLNQTAKTESLSYDAAHRLVNVNGRSALSYTPDAGGNLTQATNP